MQTRTPEQRQAELIAEAKAERKKAEAEAKKVAKAKADAELAAKAEELDQHKILSCPLCGGTEVSIKTNIGVQPILKCTVVGCEGVLMAGENFAKKVAMEVEEMTAPYKHSERCILRPSSEYGVIYESERWRPTDNDWRLR